MSEIGKSEIGKINANYGTQLGKKTSPIEEKAERTEIKEYNNPGLDAAGRAMVSSSGNIETDMAEFLKNPKRVDDAEKLYDIAMSVMPENLSEAEKAKYAAAAAVIATEG